MKSFNHILGKFRRGVRLSVQIFSLVFCLPKKRFSNSYSICLQTPLSLSHALRTQQGDRSICSCGVSDVICDVHDGVYDSSPDSRNLRTKKEVEKDDLEIVNGNPSTCRFRNCCF